MAALTAQQTREHLRVQTDALIARVSALDDLEAPSLCAGWSRAHVLSHLARNADGIGNLVRAAAGEPGTMYLSDEARDADIEAGSHRAKSEIVDDLLTTAHEVNSLLPALDDVAPEVTVERTPGGQRFRAADLAFMRLREVVYHHVDLDAGFTFADLPEDLLTHFLTDEAGRHSAHEKATTLLWLARGIRPV